MQSKYAPLKAHHEAIRRSLWSRGIYKPRFLSLFKSCRDDICCRRCIAF